MKTATQALGAARAAATGLQRRALASQAARPRHLMSIGDLQPAEFAGLVRNGAARKAAIKAGQVPPALATSLAGKAVAMMFSKRSTRTRVSTEAAVAMLGGHAMFLGKDDIQLGVGTTRPDATRRRRCCCC